MIEFREVTKSFSGRKILDRVSFKINRGEIVFVIGRSGTGKSVMLKNIVGLMKPDSGEIFVDDEEISHFSEKQLFEVRRRCGMVFQFPALLDSLTVFDNLAFGPRSHGARDEREIKDRIEKILPLVNLTPNVLDRMPAELSFGMQKRVSLARTLALDPTHLLYDEPTTSLDPISMAAVNQLIFHLARQLKVTSVVVSHDMHCAVAIADRILMLDQGRVIASGTVQEMKASDVPLVRGFLKEAEERIRVA